MLLLARRRLQTALVLALALRVVLLLWGVYQDSTSSIKYTDIDYVVFTDASRCLVNPATTPGCIFASGPLTSSLWPSLGDPYARHTYRYTPLLAILTSPNILLHPIFAKFVFIASDLLVGVLLHSLLILRSVPTSTATSYVAYVWLYNPIIANISTRGSAESVLGVLVVATLLLAERKKWGAMAMLFGFAVHFKLYPIIYGSSLLAYVASNDRAKGYRGWFGRRQLLFGLTSAATFLILNLFMFLFWGKPFIEHTFLYHVRRLDHRHNFSPYFYSYYLSSTSPSLPSVSTLFSIIRHPLSAFIPQLGLSIALGFFFGASSASPHQPSDLPFTWLIQTLVFVSFNKVCTSQYFLWYLWLLPPVLPSLSSIPKLRIASLLIAWVAAQALWLSQAYQLEMLGLPTYVRVWAAGIVFLGVNLWLITSLIQAYEPPRAVNKETRVMR